MIESEKEKYNEITGMLPDSQVSMSSIVNEDQEDISISKTVEQSILNPFSHPKLQSFQFKNSRKKDSYSSNSSNDCEEKENSRFGADVNNHYEHELFSMLSGYKVYSYPTVLSNDNA